MEAPLIYVEQRENQRQRNGRVGDAHPAEHYMRHTERTRMEAADYVCVGAEDLVVAWERIRFQELLDDIIYSNRHVTKLTKCVMFYDMTYLVVEGEFKRGADGFTLVPRWQRWEGRPHSDGQMRRGWWKPSEPIIPYGRIVKSLETVRRQLGVDIIYTEDYEETCERILDLAEWWQTPVEEHGSARRAPNPFIALGKANLVTRMSARFNGIGEKLAVRMGNAFESPHALDLASVDDLVSGVERMPRKTAERFKRQWYTGKE